MAMPRNKVYVRGEFVKNKLPREYADLKRKALPPKYHGNELQDTPYDNQSYTSFIV
jgi:hypothetical protein